MEPSKHPATDVEHATLNMPRMNSYTWRWLYRQDFTGIAHTRPVVHIRLESDRIELIYIDFRTRVWQDDVASDMIVPIQQAAIRGNITLLLFNAHGRPKSSQQLVKS